MDAVLSAFAAALDRRADGTTLQVMAGPHHVAPVGVLADVVFMDDETLEVPAPSSSWATRRPTRRPTPRSRSCGPASPP